MNILLISRCSKNAREQSCQILDQFAERKGNSAWQTAITLEGLNTLRRLTEDQAQQRIAQGKDRRSHLPFLHLKSLSTGQCFRLFIRHSELQTMPVSGLFSSYGLSDTATVPWF